MAQHFQHVSDQNITIYVWLLPCSQVCATRLYNPPSPNYLGKVRVQNGKYVHNDIMGQAWRDAISCVQPLSKIYGLLCAFNMYVVQLCGAVPTALLTLHISG